MDEWGDLLGAGVGVQYSLAGEHELHGLFGNGKEHAVKALDLVVMLAVDHPELDDGVVQAPGFVQVAEGFFRHELGLGIVAQVVGVKFHCHGLAFGSA